MSNIIQMGSCTCVETLNSKGTRFVPEQHSCEYVKKRTALVWPASIMADRNSEMVGSEEWDTEKQAIIFDKCFTAAMDKLCRENGLI